MLKLNYKKKINMRKTKLLHKTKFLSLYETENGFYFAQRRNTDSVAGLCFKKEDNQYYFLLRFQPLPEINSKLSWDELYPCPITGSCEENETHFESMVREIYEEGGIKVNKNNLVASSYCVATTQMNETVYNYLFDVTNLLQIDSVGDGSIFEKVSKNYWVDQKELEDILFNKKEKTYLSSLNVCYLLFLKYLSKI